MTKSRLQTKIVFAVALLNPSAAFCQNQQSGHATVQFNRRVAYCNEHPTDSFNCRAIPARKAKTIYVKLRIPADKNEETTLFASTFLNALRRIPDVELTDNDKADFQIGFETVAARTEQGKPIGYTMSVQLTRVYETPTFSLGAGTFGGELFPVLKDSWLSTIPVEAINQRVEAIVADMNTSCFEGLRKRW